MRNLTIKSKYYSIIIYNLIAISCCRLDPIFVQKIFNRVLQFTIIYLTKFREENENQRAKSLDN